MLRNRYVILGGVVAFLMLANLVSYFCSGWGLITVKVKDVPLKQVIKTIEWQGWVKIYSNLDPDTKVSIWVDHVPLAEAMDTLTTDLSSNGGGGFGGGRAFRGGQRDGTPPPDGGQPGTAGNNPPPAPAEGGNGPEGGARGGRGGRGGAQWGLAFFVAPSQGATTAEIRSFEGGGTDDTMKVFHYGTPLQMLAGDYDLPAIDPRLQAWPGMKETPPPTSAPVATDPNAAPAPADNGAPAAPAIDPDSLQAYLQAFAQRADVWIMTPDSWNPKISTPPAPNSSIVSAVKNLVGRANGSVVPAIILRTGRGGGGGGLRAFAGGDDTGWSDTDDRLRNAINGLPANARDNALNQLNQENKFRKDVQAAPQDQRQQMVRQHMLDKMIDGNNWQRMTPEQRAQRFQRMVSARAAAKG